MSYTLLQMVDQTMGELGLSQPTSVIGNTNNQVTQLLALSNRLGKDLVRDYEWQRLVKAYIFQTSTAITTTGTIAANSSVITSIPDTTGMAVGNVITGTGIAPYAEILTVDGANQVTMNTPATTATAAVSLVFAKQDYALPTDFDRMVSDTNWDRTNHWRNMGTKSSQEWQWLQGGVISIGPRERYRIYNDYLRIFAAITTPYTFAFEYVSNFFVVASGGTAATKASFTLDTDTSVFKDDLMLAGLKYYYLAAKKLPRDEELMTFSNIRSKCKGDDVPVPSMSLSPQLVPELIGPWSVQDGNWPQ